MMERLLWDEGVRVVRGEVVELPEGEEAYRSGVPCQIPLDQRCRSARFVSGEQTGIAVS